MAGRRFAPRFNLLEATRLAPTSADGAAAGVLESVRWHHHEIEETLLDFYEARVYRHMGDEAA